MNLVRGFKRYIYIFHIKPLETKQETRDRANGRHWMFAAKRKNRALSFPRWARGFVVDIACMLMSPGACHLQVKNSLYVCCLLRLASMHSVGVEIMKAQCRLTRLTCQLYSCNCCWKSESHSNFTIGEAHNVTVAAVVCLNLSLQPWEDSFWSKERQNFWKGQKSKWWSESETLVFLWCHAWDFWGQADARFVTCPWSQLLFWPELSGETNGIRTSGRRLAEDYSWPQATKNMELGISFFIMVVVLDAGHVGNVSFWVRCFHIF